MKQFSFDTVLEADKVLMDKVVTTIKSGDAFKLYHKDNGYENVNYRTGEFTFTLCYETFKVTDGCPKKDFFKKVSATLDDLALVVGDKCFRTNREGSKYTIQRVGLHTPNKQTVPKSAAKGSLTTVSSKIVRLADVFSELNKLTAYTNFYVTFFRRDETGKSVNESYKQTINRVASNRDNYDAFIVAEAARVMREITDTNTYGGFVPDLARIVSHDTGDVYNIEL